MCWYHCKNYCGKLTLGSRKIHQEEEEFAVLAVQLRLGIIKCMNESRDAFLTMQCLLSGTYHSGRILSSWGWFRKHPTLKLWKIRFQVKMSKTSVINTFQKQRRCDLILVCVMENTNSVVEGPLGQVRVNSAKWKQTQAPVYEFHIRFLTVKSN